MSVLAPSGHGLPNCDGAVLPFMAAPLFSGFDFMDVSPVHDGICAWRLMVTFWSSSA